MNDVNVLAVERGRRAIEQGILPGARPQRFLFVTISGAHLYGFPSKDSDIDLRGSHILSTSEVIGLREPKETFESSGGRIDGMEIDCVSHDVRKYILLLTKKNGYVLEQIFSPLIVYDCGALQELRILSKGAMTRRLVHHYKGFFRTQENLLLKDNSRTVKAVLYLFRVPMTGIHLLRTGEVEANIRVLNENVFRLPFISDLIARKTNGFEKGQLTSKEFDELFKEAKKLETELDLAAEDSTLPDEVPNFDALNEFLIRMRNQRGS